MSIEQTTTHQALGDDVRCHTHQIRQRQGKRAPEGSSADREPAGLFTRSCARGDACDREQAQRPSMTHLYRMSQLPSWSPTVKNRPTVFPTLWSKSLQSTKRGLGRNRFKLLSSCVCLLWYCSGLNCVLQKDNASVLTPGAVNGALVRNKIFADIIKSRISRWDYLELRVGPKSESSDWSPY